MLAGPGRERNEIGLPSVFGAEPPMARKPDYGQDSPAIVAGLLAASGLAFVIALSAPRFLALPVRWIGVAGGIYFLQGALGMAYYSRVGKVRLRERLLDAIPWKGDERVLDVGCGRGLLLVAAARRLTTGRATGVDLWIPGAVSGNHPQAVLENAALEGVADRVEVKEGDARQLPFPDASFDVVLSNFVLHEVKTREERGKIVREVVRVLRPGGRLLLVDFIFTKDCTQMLREAGARDAVRSRIGRLSFWVSALLSLGSNQVYRIQGTRNA
jgi:SAM-dependent methyltransferase